MTAQIKGVKTLNRMSETNNYGQIRRGAATIIKGQD